MTTKTRDIQTAYGETSIKTVQCASCEMEVPKETAERFIIGEFKDNTHRHSSEIKFRAHKVVDKGWACEHCIETGVIGYPTVNHALSDMVFYILVIGPFLLGLVIGWWFL